MFSLLRNRLGIPGIIAVIALVFAMAGGAFAAKKYVITSTKQIKPSVLKALQGKTGPAGANGTNGSNGSNGSAGATGPAGPQGPQGIQGIQGIQGKTGDPWTAGGTLPKNATETGAWGLVFEGQGATDISFAIPLAAELPSTKVIDFATATAPQKLNCDNGVAPAPSAANPEADSGFLCVFTAGFDPSGSIALISKVEPFGETGASKTGAVLVVTSAGAALGGGSWAVTG